MGLSPVAPLPSSPLESMNMDPTMMFAPPKMAVPLEGDIVPSTNDKVATTGNKFNQRMQNDNNALLRALGFMSNIGGSTPVYNSGSVTDNMLPSVGLGSAVRLPDLPNSAVQTVPIVPGLPNGAYNALSNLESQVMLPSPNNRISTYQPGSNTPASIALAHAGDAGMGLPPLPIPGQGMLGLAPMPLGIPSGQEPLLGASALMGTLVGGSLIGTGAVALSGGSPSAVSSSFANTANRVYLAQRESALATMSARAQRIQELQTAMDQQEDAITKKIEAFENLIRAQRNQEDQALSGDKNRANIVKSELEKLIAAQKTDGESINMLNTQIKRIELTEQMRVQDARLQAAKARQARVTAEADSITKESAELTAKLAALKKDKEDGGAQPAAAAPAAGGDAAAAPADAPSEH